MAIKDRFEQPSYQFFSTIEQFLLTFINSGDPYESETDALKKYSDDLDISVLPAEIQVLHSYFGNEKLARFEEIIAKSSAPT